MGSRRKKRKSNLLLWSIGYCLYFIARYFIFIGEITQNLLFFIVQLLKKAYSLLKKFLALTFFHFHSHQKKVLRLMKSDLASTTFKIRSSVLSLSKFVASSFEGLMRLPRALVRNLSNKEASFPKKTARRKKRHLFRPSLRLRFFLMGFIVASSIFFLYQVNLFFISLPSPRVLGKVNFPLSTHILDRKGRLLYEVYRDQSRTSIKLEDLPAHVINATIAIEDKDFYRHNGISVISGIGRAMKDSLQTGSLQGGSTITQQLVKSALLTPERTFSRKFKEIILALQTERLFSKREILELYLNQVPFGGASYGIEEAARNYFAKHANKLSVAEAAFLAGLPQAPTKYSPYVNPRLALGRRNDVLKNMRKLGYLTEQEYKKAVAAPLVVAPPVVPIKAPHFVFYVKDKLEREYGVDQVETGGFRVTTTLDLDIQAEVERILSEELEKVRSLNVSNGAILVTRPRTGEILAMAGSVDYFATPSGSFNVTVAARQPGSSIKPLMYSLAIENKSYTAASAIDDTPTVFTISPSEAYRPVNYDGKFHGRVSVRQALASSYNVPAVKVLNSLGVGAFVNHAKNLGITTWEDPSRFGLSLTLGAGEVTMTDMATAFGVFANEGERVALSPYLSVTEGDRKNFTPRPPSRRRVLSRGTAFIISDILSDGQARAPAFGTRSALDIQGYRVAVKTGTTNDKKDNWTIGYTPDFLVSVWVGNNDNTPMHPQLTSGITGAAPVWNRVMTYLLQNYATQTSWFEEPSSEITAVSCYRGRAEYLLKGTEAKAPCQNFVFNVSPTPRPQ